MALSARGFLKFKGVVGLAVLAVFLLVAATYSAQKKVSAGAVISWKGSVYIERAAGGKAEVERQETLYEGDTIETMEGSMAKLLMKDDTVMALSAKTVFKIEGYAVDSTKNVRTTRIKMTRGVLRTYAGRFFGGADSKFSVESPTAVAGAKGTGWLQVVKENGETEVLVLSSIVTVTNVDPNVVGTVDVETMKMTTVTQGKPPTEPVDIPDGYLDQLLNSTDISVTEVSDAAASAAGGEEFGAQTVESISCIECHAPVREKMVTFRIPHPKSDESCIVCHLLPFDKPVVLSADIFTDGGLIDMALNDGIAYDVTIKLTDGVARTASAGPIVVASGSGAPGLVDDGSAPVISNLRVTEVVAGMFFAAVVEWDTNKPTRAKVNFGKTETLGTIVRSQAGDSVYLMRHRIRLDRLKSGETYYISAESQDIFGKAVLSQAIKFLVEKPFANIDEDPNAALPPELKGVKLVNAGGKPVLSWGANKRVKVAVELKESEVRTKDKPHYPGFKSGAAVGVDACNTCHGGGSHKQTGHPVGSMRWVMAKKNPKLPYDASGNIMCSTCHPGHGGQFDKMLRDEESLLCDSCHNK
ncbi:MAG: FecR domain-containing protein [Deltaproteobacteria bacterium]|nr:FecR domain-containing protein [Deltaproteobacteria bacterium]